MVKPLSIENALRLYVLLSPYLPDIQEVNTGLELISGILDKIKSAGNPRDYLEIVSLMTDISVDDIIETMNIDDILQAFSDGLHTNKIFELKDFCEKVGIHG